jgi:general secretion pathway protein C
VLGVQLAWWGWHFFGKPRAATVTATAASTTIDAAMAAQLMGPVTGGVANSMADAAATNNSGIRLKGVYAVNGKTLSAAIVNTGGRDNSVRVNEKITESVTLTAVAHDHIVVSRAGVREKISLEMVTAKSAAGVSNAAPNATPNTKNFRLNVASSSHNNFSLSRAELNSVLQDPRQVNFLGGISAAPSGGVQVTDAQTGTLAHKLGLQAGDIIASINGQPVNSTGDLARFYGQFGATNSIRAEIRRGGTPIQMSYIINP